MRKLRRKKGSRLVVTRQSETLREPSSMIGRSRLTQAALMEDKNQQSVCFTGHRYMAAAEVPAVISRLDEQLEMCYERGYRNFLCGGALGFDTLAGERVAAMQAVHPDVRLIMVLPCSDQSRRWPDYALPRYERLLYMADDIRVLSPAYYDGCMQVRNRYMVDHSELCICYLRHQKGGTASTVAYALKQQLPVLNVAMADVSNAFPFPKR